MNKNSKGQTPGPPGMPHYHLMLSYRLYPAGWVGDIVLYCAELPQNPPSLSPLAMSPQNKHKSVYHRFVWAKPFEYLTRRRKESKNHDPLIKQGRGEGLN